MKFLVLWSLEIQLLSPEVLKAVLRQRDHAKKLAGEGKLVQHYHIPGRHGGAWIYDVSSNEELDHLLAASPVFNFAKYEIYPLAEMSDQASVFYPPQT